MVFTNRLVLVLITFAMLFFSCSEETTESKAETDAEIAEGLWQQMISENYSDTNGSWSYWPGKTGKYLPDTTLMGSDPHIGPQVFQTFVNSTGMSGLTSNSRPLADKSIIVKQNYIISGQDTMLAAITAMLKRQGYDPDHNDWFWAKYTADGTIDASGKVDGCINCHSGANTFHGNDADYIWTRIP